MENKKLNWELIPSQGESYTPRTGHTVVAYKNAIYVFAGTDDLSRQNDLYKFDEGNLMWEKVTATGEFPAPRSGVQSIIHKDTMYVFGGYAKKVNEYYNDLYKLDLITKKWARILTKEIIPPRVDHIFVLFHDNAFVFGGTDGKRKFKDLQELYLERGEWRKIVSKEIWPSPRFGHSCVAYGDSLYMFGGWDGTNTLNDFWQYSPFSQTWKLISTRTAIASRYRHVSVVFKQSMYIFGGVDKDQERFGDLLEYNFQEASWKRIIPLNEGPSARTFHRSVVVNSNLYIVGGFDGKRLNDLYRIDLNNKTSVNEFSCTSLSLSSSQVFEPHGQLPFVDFTKSYSEFKAIINFAKNSKNSNEELGFHKLPVHRWFAFVPKSENYSARTGHAAVLVGQKIYLFGGVDAGGAVKNDFSVFDLRLETWSKVECSGKLPHPRSGCKCVADDPLIYFYGGYSVKTTTVKEFYSDIYCFDTVNSTWSEITYNIQPSHPAKRTDHSLVFFSDALYVFGGKGGRQGQDEIYKDFFKFNLKSKVWTEIKGERAVLQPRFGHSANVYKDSMYVFGGWDGMVCLDELYQYSFNTNIWYNLRTSGQIPNPRYRHDAITHMNSLYIFGGVNAAQIRFNDLYQYNFELREWKCIAVSGCLPSPRSFHKLVNYENIIFLLGGFDGERKNDMYTILVENTENVRLSRPGSKRFLDFEELDQQESLENPMIAEPPTQYLIRMLNEQVLELSQKLQKEEERHLCKICFTKEIDVLFLECCHFVCCCICSASLKQYCINNSAQFAEKKYSKLSKHIIPDNLSVGTALWGFIEKIHYFLIL